MQASSEMDVYSFLAFIQNSHKLYLENSRCHHVGTNAASSISVSALQQR